MEEIVTFWIAVSSFALGAIGTTLGVLTYWKLVDQDRLKLRVSSTYGTGVGGLDGLNLIGIEVVNRSAFPVTIVEVGYTRKGDNHRAVLLNNTRLPGDQVPMRLEPRESATYYVEQGGLGLKVQPTHVHAKTACGETVMFRQKHLPGPGD